jgi:hypothetical protein
MGSTKGATTKSTSKLPKEFRAAYTEALGMARDATSQPYEAYQGQLVAGLNGQQQQGMANINEAQGMALPFIQRGADLSEEAARGITPELYDRFYSPYVRDVANSTFGNMMESNAQQLSGLKGGAIQAGAFGGDRSGIAAAELARQQNLALGQTMSGVYNTGYTNAMGLAGQQVQNLGAMGQQIAGLGAGAQSSVLQGAQAQLAAGAQQQATEQAQLSAAYDQYQQKMAYPYQQAQFFGNIAEGLGSTSGGTSSTTTPGPSVASQVIGGIGAAANLASLSDERVKENIQPIGKLADGQIIYRYNFKGDPKTQIGLIAQEVEQTNPDAIADLGGLKGVDYAKATDDAAAGAAEGGLGRAGFAEGGVPFAPWGDAVGWVPEGKIGKGGGMGIPEPPRPAEDKGLDASWGELKPFDANQIAGLGNLTYAAGIPMPGNHVSQNRGGRIGLAGGGDVPPSEEEVKAYIINAAKERGVDPDTALKVWTSEGRSGDPTEAWRSKGTLKDGRRESSYGPFQLNVDGGVGADMIKDTGLSPADVKNWRPGVDYALDTAKKGGWGPWMGAKAIGLPSRAGLDGGPVGGLSASASGIPEPTGLSPGPGIEPASDTAPVTDTPEQSKGLGRFFASDTNPSIVESVIGRRLSPEARNAMLTASFAMMAGRSPFFGVNLGEAGKAGMETYYNALGQKRENAKVASDIGRQAFEANTGRMTVEVADKNSKRQLAALIIPMIRTYMALGQPVPPQYIAMIDEAFPKGSEARQNLEQSLDTGVASSPLPPMGGGASGAPAGPVTPPDSPAPAPTAIPAPDSPGPVGGSLPPPTGTETVGNQPAPDALRSAYDGVPQQLNPYWWDSRAATAEKAADAETAQRFRDRATEIRKADQDRGYIMVPGKGRIPYPGLLDQNAAKIENEEQAKLKVSSTQDQTTHALENVKNYQTAAATLDSAAKTLASTETGRFSDSKAYLVTALKSLGLDADAAELDQAEGTQKLEKAFSNILFNGGLKDKIGSQIAATELQMFKKGFGDVSMEPGANRYIVGMMRGILNMESQKAKDWIDYAGGQKALSQLEIAKWEKDWNASHKPGDFITKSIAQTPAAGEVDWARFGDDPEYRKAWNQKFTPGYQYVMPDGKVKTYTGRKEDGYFVASGGDNG